MAGPSRTCTSELLFQKTDRVLGWESSDPLGSSPARLGLSFLLGSTTGLDTLIPRPLSALPLHSLTFPSGAAGSALGKVQALSQHQGQGPRGALRRTQGHFLASPDDLRGSGAGVGRRRGESCVCLGECCGGRWGGEGAPRTRQGQSPLRSRRFRAEGPRAAAASRAPASPAAGARCSAPGSP